MNKSIVALYLLLMPGAAMAQTNQPMNDSNTPLHLLKPGYKVAYGVSTVAEVKGTMDRVLNYINSCTPAAVID